MLGGTFARARSAEKQKWVIEKRAGWNLNPELNETPLKTFSRVNAPMWLQFRIARVCFLLFGQPLKDQLRH